jgi:hypothetical protein
LGVGFVKIGKRFLVHPSRPGCDWVLFYNPAGGQNVHRVDPYDPVVVSAIFDLAVTAYDSLVIDQNMDRDVLDEKIRELIGSHNLATVNAWLATCWLGAKIQGNPSQGAKKYKKGIPVDEMRIKAEMIYGKNDEWNGGDGECEGEECNGEGRYAGIISMRDIVRQLLKNR